MDDDELLRAVQEYHAALDALAEFLNDPSADLERYEEVSDALEAAHRRYQRAIEP